MKANTGRFIWRLLLLIIALNLSFSTAAQKSKPKAKKTENTVYSVAPNAGILQTEYSNSKLLGRTVTYNVILPFNYKAKENSEKRFPVIYLLHGLTGSYSDWASRTNIEEYAFRRDVLIVMPDGADGWYTDSATVAGDKYESFLIEELIPEIDIKFRTLSDRRHRAVAGLSMGGYGAIKFGLKYPEKFSLAGAFSGALDAPQRGQNHQFLRPSINSVFGADDSRTRRDNDIFRLVREMPAEKIKELPFFYLDCGTEDWLFQTNRDFAGLLFEKKIPHEFRQLPGKHDWKYWDAQVREFLELSESILAAAKAKGN